MSAAIFSGGYAKILANLGIKLKDDTRILSGSVDPSVTNPSAPDGSIYLSSGFGVFSREGGVWNKLSTGPSPSITTYNATLSNGLLYPIWDFTSPLKLPNPSTLPTGNVS